MTTFTDMQWFAIQVRPTTEAAAEFSLSSLIETLLSLVRRPVRHATRAGVCSLRPLSRLSVRALLRGRFTSRRYIQSRRGARGRNGRSASPVEDSIIASIRERIGADGW